MTKFSDVISKPEAFINELKLLENKSNDKSYEHLFAITNVEVFWFKVGNLKSNLNEYLYVPKFVPICHICFYIAP